MDSAFKYIDITVRGIALVALVPFGLLALILAIMATGAPNSGILPMLIILGVAGTLMLLILYSCLEPEILSKPFMRFGKIGVVIGRAPAYLFAPVGLYYGSRILMNFHLF